VDNLTNPGKEGEWEFCQVWCPSEFFSLGTNLFF
jgi:hypothetical protein